VRAWPRAPASALDVIALSPMSSASDIARRLVSTPTVNPPGNEEPAQDILASLIESAGVEVQRYELVSGRPNLVARLEGRGARSPLVLHAHVDVVGVDGQRWDRPPFEGLVEDGVLHGRGALDMKSGAAMYTHALIRAKTEGLVPSGDVIVILAVDSETGGSAGMRYLLDEHSEVLSDAEFAIGEFGAFPLHAFNRKLYPIGVSMKSYLHLRLSLRGRGGHGSSVVGSTVLGRLGRALERLDSASYAHHSSPVTEKIVESIAATVSADTAADLKLLLEPDSFDEALSRLGPESSVFAGMFQDTANPTLVRSGEKFNVIPSEATIELDCRLLPGRNAEQLISDVRQVVADDDLIIEVLDAGPPSETDFDLRLFGELASVLTDLDPSGTPIPFLFNESPDGRLFAEHGIQHYGYVPMDLPPGIQLLDLIHGPNERIPLSAIDFGAEALYRLLARF
jgi:acetylornithine deacetylase/succinyl-diaminopimelate desuccinylase-like protein